MRIVVSRLLLACAGVVTLLLALSLPSPWNATPFELILQGVYFLASIGSFVALFRIRGDPSWGPSRTGRPNNSSESMPTLSPC